MRSLVLIYPTPMADDVPMEGKFLQLRLAARDYILCATAIECRYHNQILARFLSEQGLPHRWEGDEKLVVDRSELAVTGGGRFHLDLMRESLHVWDDSSVYGRFDPSRLAAQLAAAGPPWERLVLSVG
ncbi:MAG: hypothetical protein ABFS45_17355 [Pseudomonadota bacterium]